MLIYICVIIWNQKFWNQRKLFFWLYMGILKSLGAPDTRQTCFFRSFFVIDLFYIAKVTSFYGLLFLLWLTIEKTGILVLMHVSEHGPSTRLWQNLRISIEWTGLSRKMRWLPWGKKSLTYLNWIKQNWRLVKFKRVCCKIFEIMFDIFLSKGILI